MSVQLSVPELTTGEEIRSSVFYVYRNGRWCYGGCGCNNYADQKCANVDSSRIVHGNRDAIVVLDGVQHRLSTQYYTYTSSSKAAAEAVAQGIATIPHAGAYRLSLMRGY